LKRRIPIALAGAWLSVCAHAQTPPPPAPAAAPSGPSSPGAGDSATPSGGVGGAASGAGAASPQRVEITGGRSDSDIRRQSTAAKIVVGRDEIERQGDATLGEILKRLPGVTLGGPPGRGGAIRFRGLGAGYTQILLDGDRVPSGFQIDSISPDQIERIEILRAPTAETGARAIGGTINIITREGYARKVNDVRIGAQLENDHLGAGASWTRNDKLGERWTLNLSLSGVANEQEEHTVTTTTDTDLATGNVTRLAEEDSARNVRRKRLHLSTRAQYQDDQGNFGFIAPFAVLSDADATRLSTIVQPIGIDPPAYDHALSDTQYRFSLLRVLGQWRHRLGDGTRLEWRGNGGQTQIREHTVRDERDAADTLLATVEDSSHIQDRSLSGGLKASKLLDNEHSLVGGIEGETVRRDETRITLRNGAPLLTEFGENLQASSSRSAAYVQDEWTINPHWAAHAGLRWEGIVTEGTGADGTTPRNRSSVWTPLLHAVWKPDPKGRDQIRMSLTRSYKSPTLSSLVGRPGLSFRFPPPGTNTPTSPDRAGNPDLKPELATGIDIAAERYLAAGGVLSVNLFYRQISDYMRSVTTLETVSWAPVPRWVSRPQNVGDASTQGLELEAKFRLSEVMADAPPLELRSNMSFFHSRVKSVPGPENRLDQQPDMTFNLGADYRFRAVPLTLGGNLNYTPDYDTRLAEEQSALTGSKRVFDVYALWTFKPGLALRLSANNWLPRDYLTGSALDFESSPGTFTRESTRTVTSSFTQWQLRLEMKL
jgi:outer membrane receptor for ferrienterochelin and colicins